ncbi:MAG: NusG domain II-containing protein [Lachnospiraceae bacterium]|nr:NusG domain II-containing protein [Lachnospiraceae bacterium]
MFRKKDFLLITAIIVIAVVSAILIALAQSEAGAMIRITIDGTFYGEYSLSENQTISVDETLGYNRIVIENGSAYMAEADCPDKYCMDYLPIAKNGETIICLPHKLVVEVVGTQDARQLDVVVP